MERHGTIKAVKSAAETILGALSFPSTRALDFTKAHMKNPSRTALVILAGITILVWSTYLGIEYAPTSVPWEVVAIVVTTIVYFNAVVFVNGWQKSIRNEFGNYNIANRFDFIKVEKMGPAATYVVLVFSLILGVAEVYYGKMYPRYLIGVPYALFFGGQGVLRLRISREKILRTIKEGIIGIRQLPAQHQQAAMSLLRNEVSRRMHSFAPLMSLSLNPILDSIYYIGFRGTEEQTANVAQFLDTLESDLLTSKDPQTMFNHIMGCNLAHETLPKDRVITFNWESRTDWRKRLATVGQVAIGLSSVISTLVALKII